MASIFPPHHGVNILPKAKSLTAAAWKMASIFLSEKDFSFARRSAVVEKIFTDCRLALARISR